MQDSPSIYGDDDNASEGSPSDQQHDDKGQETAVIPSELCPGMKVGDEIKLKIVSTGEDSYEVAYEKDSESPGEDAKGPVAPPDSMDEVMG